MKIKILQSCSGMDFSYRQSEIVEVSAAIGKDLVDGGLAEEIKDTAPKKKAGAKDNAESE